MARIWIPRTGSSGRGRGSWSGWGLGKGSRRGSRAGSPSGSGGSPGVLGSGGSGGSSSGAGGGIGTSGGSNGICARIGGRGMRMGRWGHGIPSGIMGDPGRLTAGRSLICPKRLSGPLVPRPRFGRALFFGLNRKEAGKPLNAAEDGCDCIPQKRKVPDLLRGPASIAAERRTFQRGTAAAPHKVQAVQRHNARTLGIMQCEMTACQA